MRVRRDVTGGMMRHKDEGLAYGYPVTQPNLVLRISVSTFSAPRGRGWEEGGEMRIISPPREGVSWPPGALG